MSSSESKTCAASLGVFLLLLFSSGCALRWSCQIFSTFPAPRPQFSAINANIASEGVALRDRELALRYRHTVFTVSTEIERALADFSLIASCVSLEACFHIGLSSNSLRSSLSPSNIGRHFLQAATMAFFSSGLISSTRPEPIFFIPFQIFVIHLAASRRLSRFLSVVCICCNSISVSTTR